MALQRLIIDGFGQVELNRVTFSRTGEVEAQCGWDVKDSEDKPVICENGMLLAVDKANSAIVLPSEDAVLIGLNYSAEHMYDTYVKAKLGVPGVEWTNSSRYANYFLGVDGGNFLPRIGFLSKGDVFMTDCVCYDSSDFADDAAVMEAVKACGETAIYGEACELGAIKLSKTKNDAPIGGVLLKVVNDANKLGGFAMADGNPGIKFQVISA